MRPAASCSRERLEQFESMPQRAKPSLGERPSCFADHLLADGNIETVVCQEEPERPFPVAHKSKAIP